MKIKAILFIVVSMGIILAAYALSEIQGDDSGLWVNIAITGICFSLIKNKRI